MKIITYNVNGLRAAVTKGFPEWLAQEQPDVLCLQETKLQPEQYPACLLYTSIRVVNRLQNAFPKF